MQWQWRAEEQTTPTPAAAYAAGYACGRDGATQENAAATFAVTQLTEREWLLDAALAASAVAA